MENLSDGSIKTNHGLKQGDPVSPYFLFILVADILNYMLQLVYSNNLITGISPSSFIENINIFSMKTSLSSFSRTSKQNIKHLKFIIYSFDVACGLTINFMKRSLIGIRLNQNKCSLFSNIMECSQSSLPLNYLDFPLHYNKARRFDWVVLEQKVEKNLEAWKRSPLSLARRLAL